MQRIRIKSRHRILAILFTTSIVSFIDRTAMTVSLPFMKADFQLTAVESGFVLSAFFAAYSLVQIPGGLLADRFGVRKVITAALVWWSFFTAVTGSVASFSQMLVARFLFGLGEGVYPACAFKAIATWFPKRSRGTANAIMLSSSRLGGAIAPLVVIWILSSFGGWRYVFLSLCIPGFLVAALVWFFVPNTPAESRSISEEERKELNEDNTTTVSSEAASTSLWVALRDITTLRYALIYFLFDFAFWGYTAWLPTYLIEERGFSMLQMGIASSLPPLAGTAGCILGGWASDRFFGRSRRIPIIVLPVAAAVCLYLTYVATSVAIVMVTQTALGFLLNFFFGAFWALPMSTIPKERMGVSTGAINMGGQLAGALSPVVVGALITVTGGQYGLTFGFLIVSLVLVSIVALSLPGGSRTDNPTLR